MADWTDLSAGRVRALLAKASTTRAFTVAWPNVQRAAMQFWDAQKGGDELAKATTWHHLVMSVGNFKRQGGSISLFDLPSSFEPTGLDGDPLEDCNVLVRSRSSGVTSAISLAADDPMTWRLLDQVDGLAVATSTTLLSALWPGRHFVIDVRDLNAAIALDFVEAQAKGVDPASQGNVKTTWEWYGWLRDKLFVKTQELKTADATITFLEVERALYLLDKQVKRPGKGKPLLTYQQYVDLLDKALKSL